jgi:hypothetical protein
MSLCLHLAQSDLERILIITRRRDPISVFFSHIFDRPESLLWILFATVLSKEGGLKPF